MTTATEPDPKHPADRKAARKALYWKYEQPRAAPGERWCCGTSEGTEHEGSCPTRRRQAPVAAVAAQRAESFTEVCVRCHRPLEEGELAAMCDRCMKASEHDQAVWLSTDSPYAIRSRQGHGAGYSMGMLG